MARWFLLFTLSTCFTLMLLQTDRAIGAEGDDKEQGDITSQDINDTATLWAIDGDGKMFQWTLKRYGAVNGPTLIATHVRLSGTERSPDRPRNISHWHQFTQDNKSVFLDAGDQNGPSIPKKSEVNAYWDKRFEKCTRVGGPDILVCHEWALATSPHASGTYNYAITSGRLATTYVFDVKDLAVNDPAVQVDDQLVYSDHTSLVTEVANNKPKKIRWKWLESGAYEYQTPAGHEWDTPICENGFYQTDTGQGATPAAKGWVWDADFCTGPTVYTESDPEP